MPPPLVGILAGLQAFGNSIMGKDKGDTEIMKRGPSLYR
jgi:hypothetical protein